MSVSFILEKAENEFTLQAPFSCILLVLVRIAGTTWSWFWETGGRGAYLRLFIRFDWFIYDVDLPPIIQCASTWRCLPAYAYVRPYADACMLYKARDCWHNHSSSYSLSCCNSEVNISQATTVATTQLNDTVRLRDSLHFGVVCGTYIPTWGRHPTLAPSRTSCQKATHLARYHAP